MPSLTSIVTRISALVPDRVFTSAIAATYPRFEPDLARLDDFCPRGGTALDVGAWYGPWTRAMAKRADRVIAVEPNPSVAAVLRRTAPANASVVQAAITDEPGEGILYVPGTGQGTEGVATMLDGTHERGVPVRTTTVDALTDDVVTIVKIDVEGLEMRVLRGAERVLTEHRPTLLIELEYRRSPVDEVVAHLADRGYTAHVLVDGAWRSLDTYDLAAHQAALLPVVDGRGYLERVVRGRPHYVNNVLFLGR